MSHISYTGKIKSGVFLVLDDNRNLCSHAGVYVCVCVYVCGDAQLVITISHEGKLGQISYLVCKCIISSKRSLLLLWRPKVILV